MVLPIVAYGTPVLSKKAAEISKDYPELKSLIRDMFDTMDTSNGVGLAAPQIGLSIRLFVADASPFAEDEDITDPAEQKYLKGFRKVFINPEIIDFSEEEWTFEEGCLSIPTVREDVVRPARITMRYLDEKFVSHQEEFHGLPARIIQHEYDHIEGILFVDHLNGLKKKFLKKKLAEISVGQVKVNYKMKFLKK